MRVHDVERRARGPAGERRGGPVAAAQIAGRLGERAGAGGKLVELDLEVGILQASQIGDLIADEGAALGVRGVGPHVGEHERAHDPPTVALRALG